MAKPTVSEQLELGLRIVKDVESVQNWALVLVLIPVQMSSLQLQEVSDTWRVPMEFARSSLHWDSIRHDGPCIDIYVNKRGFTVFKSPVSNHANCFLWFNDHEPTKIKYLFIYHMQHDIKVSKTKIKKCSHMFFLFSVLNEFAKFYQLLPMLLSHVLNDLLFPWFYQPVFLRKSRPQEAAPFGLRQAPWAQRNHGPRVDARGKKKKNVVTNVVKSTKIYNVL